MLPKNNEIYRHFKGNLYKVLTLATHSETGEQMVVYQALYGDFQVYCRPLDMFVSEVDHDKYPEITQKFRFEPVGDILNIDVSVKNISGNSTGSVSGNQAKMVDISENTDAEKVNISENADVEMVDISKMAKTESFPKDTNYSQTPGKGATENTTKPSEPATEDFAETSKEEMNGVDPLILEFLDAESVTEKRNILTALHHRITDEMINTLAVAMDVVIEDGDIEDRYSQLRACLATIEKYEIERKY